MKSSINASSPVELFIKTLRLFICIALGAFLTGCATFATSSVDKDEVRWKPFRLTGNPNRHKNILVFLDGTLNDPGSGTNIWRLFDLMSKNNDPQTTGIYIAGVGSILDKPLSGPVLGRGMEKRILKGYGFIAQNYNPGDDIFIFGFSRGAHQARSLAGLIAYAGVPRLSDDDRHQLARDDDYLKDIGDDILELTKEKSDEDYRADWESWKPGQAPLLAAEIRDKLQLEMQAAEVKFLGVWDTVPGSSFKKYENCKEEIGFWKTWFHWLPMISKGERYKTGSYPAIQHIAHAVSLDEKRSKFEPLLLCGAINQNYTKVSEVWFPGAHSDVGGGYDDDEDPFNELPGISLNWMIKQLGESYYFTTPVPPFPESAVGLAHRSIDRFPGNVDSECKDRPYPAETQIHKSVEVRKNAGAVPIRVNGKKELRPYPMKCRR